MMKFYLLVFSIAAIANNYAVAQLATFENSVDAVQVFDGDEIMLVSGGGHLIRVPVSGISMLGRSTQGVTVFDTAEDEKVVSVEHIREGDDEDDEADEGAGNAGDE